MALYSFFGGFSFDNTSNSSIIVRNGEAVAFPCNVSTSLPQPNIVWYKDDQPIQLSSLADDSKYIALNEYLVIYDLTSDDISSSYRCGVDNVEITRSVNSTYSYTLTENTTLSDGFIIYRGPVTPKVVRPNETPVLFYYIVATNDNTARGTIIETLDLAQQPDNTDTHLLRIAIPNEGTDRSITISARDRATTLAETSTIVGFTVAEPLTILQTPSMITADNDTLQLFSIFEAESINFTCAANGTGVSLSWYFNGRKLPNVNSNTLELTNVTTDNSGIYQCEWTTAFDDEYKQTTWGLSVRMPMQPRQFSFTSTGDVFGNRTIASPGTSVVLSLTFIADIIPTVQWNFRSTNGITTLLNPSTNSRYESSGPFVVPKTASMYIANLTIHNVTVDVCGYYFAIINDMRTLPATSPEWFISQTISNEIISFGLTPYNCLLNNTTLDLICVVRGLPVPSVMFFYKNTAILPTDSFTNYSAGITQNSLKVTAHEEADGLYTCVLGNHQIRKDLDTDYCTLPVITSTSNPQPVVLLGESVTLSCTVDSIPVDKVTVQWFKNGSLISTNDTAYNVDQSSQTYHLTINTSRAEHDSNYQRYICVATNVIIPSTVNASFILTIEAPTPLADTSSLLVVLVIVGVLGGIMMIIAIISAVITVIYCYFKRKPPGTTPSHVDPHSIATVQNEAYSAVIVPPPVHTEYETVN
jgi:hypothetical protein